MTNSFRTIYLYIVSLITLSMIIGGIVATVNNVTSYFYPDSYVFFETETETTNSYKYDTSYNDDDFETTRNNMIRRENYKKQKIKNAVVSVAVIVVGAIMYRYHWNLIEKERIK